jgi:4-diphosphocytidyl-2-C-methyl-D-erythritol kinase
MIDFPNAKINLGLNILGKRKDGYHEISTCFYPIGLKDALEIIPASSKKTAISISGIEIPGNPDENLCLKAFYLMKKDFELPNVQIHLHKVIPAGGGLGGGSSDAAFTLKLLDRLFHLFLDPDLLAWYAAKLGSDCPFFIYDEPVIASGKGEIIEEITVPISGKHIIIINPGIMIPTAEAYRMITPRKPEFSLKDVLQNHSLNQWKDILVNDFEEQVSAKYPELTEIKKMLYEMGAIYAAISGSGSSMFGIFEEQPTGIPPCPPRYQSWMGIL